MRKGKSMVIKKEKDASSALGEETFKRMIVWIDVKIDTCHRMKKIQVFFIDQVKHLLIIFSSFPPSTIYRRIPNHFSFSRVHWIFPNYHYLYNYAIISFFYFHEFCAFGVKSIFVVPVFFLLSTNLRISCTIKCFKTVFTVHFKVEQMGFHLYHNLLNFKT